MGGTHEIGPATPRPKKDKSGAADGGRLEQALSLSGEKKGAVAEISEVFRAGAEAQKNMGRAEKRRPLLARLVIGHGWMNIHDEIKFAMPDITEEARALGEIVERRLDAGTLYDPDTGKLSEATFAEVGKLGYYGLMIERDLGGRGLRISQCADVIAEMVKKGSYDLGLGISVDEGIGMVRPIVLYGTEDQQLAFLPAKAIGKIRSWFGLTERQAGSAVVRIQTRFVQDPDDPEMLLVYGHKCFITGARLSTDEVISAGILNGIDDKGKKRCLIVELPKAESAEFRLVPYGLLPISRAWNTGMEFNGFRVPKKNLIEKSGLVVPFSLLNSGRYFLLAGAWGLAVRYLADLVGYKKGTPEKGFQDIGWVNFRYVQGRPIGDFEIVRHRLADMLGMSVTLRSLMATMGYVMDEGELGELEGLVAKPTASQYANHVGDLSLMTLGGRGLLEESESGRETHDRRAIKIYEGEDTVLILKFIAMVMGELQETVFAGVFDALSLMLGQDNGAAPSDIWESLFGAIGKGKVANAIWSVVDAAWSGVKRVWGLVKFFWHLPPVMLWVLLKVVRLHYGQPCKGMPGKLRSHLAFALRFIERKAPLRITWLFLRYGTSLPKHQAPVFRLGQKLMYAVRIVHTALWVSKFGDPLEQEAAIHHLSELRRLILAPEPSASDDARANRVAQQIIDGECRMLDGVPIAAIRFPYHEPALRARQPIARPDPVHLYDAIAAGKK